MERTMRRTRHGIVSVSLCGTKIGAEHNEMAFGEGLSNLIDSSTLKWIAFTAKGGQGKTTCACSAAIQAALRRPNQRILVISTDPAHNVSDAFGQRFARDPLPVRGYPNLYAMEIDPERDFAETDLGRALLGNDWDTSRAQAEGENRSEATSIEEDPFGLSGLVTELVSSVPGIDEALSFGQMMKSVQELTFDLVIFDMAPTGHALKLLSFPSVLEKGLSRLLDLRTRLAPMLSMASSMMRLGGASDLGPSMNAFDEEIVSKVEELLAIVRKVDEQFRDPSRTAFVCVCMPEFLSVYETERLLRELRRMHMTCRNLLVNQVLWVADLPEQIPQPPAKYLALPLPEERRGWTALTLFQSRVDIQSKYLQQIEDLYAEDFHITRVPMLRNEVRGVADLRAFGERLLRDSGIRPIEPAESSPYAPSLRNVLEAHSLELIIASGKGNVGKTTTTSALAVQLAEDRQYRRRVLLVSTDPAHSLSDAFGQNFTVSLPSTQSMSVNDIDQVMRPVRVTEIAGPGTLDVLEVDTAHFLQDIGSSMEPTSLYRTDANAESQADPRTALAAMMLGASPSDIIRDLLQAVPGLDDAIAFTRLMQRIQELDYDVIVLDTAPTGHTLRLLSFPALLQKGLQKLEEMRQRFAGALSMASTLAESSGLGAASGRRPDEDLAERLQNMQETILRVVKQFRDPERTTFICVCIAEFLSVYETERLIQDLAEHCIDAHNIVVNQLFPSDANETERIDMVSARVQMQQKYMRHIDELYARDMRISVLPLEPQEVRGTEALRRFGERLAH
jgi:arsenite-transporting ATPase